MVVDALADKHLYEQELAKMRKENAFLGDQASAASSLRATLPDQRYYSVAVYESAGCACHTLHSNVTTAARDGHLVSVCTPNFAAGESKTNGTPSRSTSTALAQRPRASLEATTVSYPRSAVSRRCEG